MKKRVKNEKREPQEPLQHHLEDLTTDGVGLLTFHRHLYKNGLSIMVKNTDGLGMKVRRLVNLGILLIVGQDQTKMKNGVVVLQIKSQSTLNQVAQHQQLPQHQELQQTHQHNHQLQIRLKEEHLVC